MAQKVLQPAFANFQNHLKSLERSSSRYLKLKVNTKPIIFELKNYQEKELETNVICDNCGLVFSIYGVFSHCPDCGKINSLTILKGSLEICLKKVKLSNDPNLSPDLANAILADALTGCVSSLDSFGKSLKSEHKIFFENTQRNIFQNLFQLNQLFSKKNGHNIEDYVGHEDFNFVLKMFQVRHINEHNAGVIDDDFCKKVPGYAQLIGRKHNLNGKEVEKLVAILKKIANHVITELVGKT